MKNSEIHNGLPEKELREFLSKTLVKIWDMESNTKKIDVPHNSSLPLDYDIKQMEQEIVFLNKKLEFLKEKSAIIHVIKMNNWEEFDVSDETVNDTPYRLAKNFIGTQKEYEELMSTIKKEE